MSTTLTMFTTIIFHRKNARILVENQRKIVYYIWKIKDRNKGSTSMVYKFTFKAQKQGTWDLFKAIDIKYRGEVVGYMQSTPDNKWFIRLQIPASEAALKENPNCPWMWGKIKRLFTTADEAKLWLNENREKLLTSIYFEKNNT